MSSQKQPDVSAPPHGQPPVITEVRYSLPELLAELQLERTSGAFAQEKLHQVEIEQLFQNRKKRRGPKN